MKNKLVDLNNHLFAQLERLNDESITGEKLNEEIERSRAIGGIARHLIDNARLALDACKAVHEGLIKNTPQMLGIEYKDAD